MWSTGSKGLSWVDPKTTSGIETRRKYPFHHWNASWTWDVFQVLTCEKWVESRSYLGLNAINCQLFVSGRWILYAGGYTQVNWRMTSQLAQEKVKNRAPPELKADQPAIWVILSFACKYMFKEFFSQGSNKTGKKSSNHAGRANFQRRITKLANLPTCPIMENDPFFWAKDGIREQFLAGNKCLGCVRETSSKNGPRYLGWWIIM